MALSCGKSIPFLIIVFSAMCIILRVQHNNKFLPSEKVWPTLSWKNRSWNRETADNIIRSYIHHRKLGWSRKKIAVKIFEAAERLSHSRITEDICYPFLCDTVLKAYADVTIQRGKVTSKKKPSQIECGNVVFIDVAHFDGQFDWFRKYLPSIKAPYVLVTRNCDKMMPRMALGWEEVLQHPLLIKWYTVNPSPFFNSHPKVAVLPLGFRPNREIWNNLDSILMKDNLNPIHSQYLSETEKNKRPFLVYINYDEKKYHMDRVELALMFKDIGTYLEKPVDLSLYLEHLTKSKFVLSPQGNGMDCYRTYQAILLQAVPIVQDLSTRLTDIIQLAPAFVLPKKWKEFLVNNTFFESLVANNTLGRSVILADFWLDKIEQTKFESCQKLLY